MSQHYSDPEREDDPHALPDIEVFEMTAEEVAERDEDLVQEYMKMHEFRLASMNSQVRAAMFDRMVEDEAIHGGWFYWYCFPGCLPDSEPVGPFDTRDAAILAAQGDSADESDDTDPNTVTYTLPAYWASYLINGDASGLEDGEQAQIDAFLKSEGLGDALDCSEESWFAHSNDATNLGGDVCEYTFAKSTE